MKSKLTLMGVVCTAVLLTGCGGGSSSAPAAPVASETDTETGVFLDEAVGNIGYRTETLEGVTDSQGRYEYIEGETVTFFIGDLEFPPVTASEIVTPLTIADTDDTSDPTVVNILRLLQSIDEDGDPDNGITITNDAKSAATQVNFDQSVSDFAASSSVTALVANSGSVNSTLITESEAIAHFEDTLIDAGEAFVPSNSIAGVWVNEETTNELLAFVFFQDGTYVHMEIDEVAPLNPDNPEEVSGMEWGTYSIDTETGELTASITFDGNFDTGLTDSIGQVDMFVQVDGDTLTFQVDDNDNSTIDEGEATIFTRSSNNGILGAWTNYETTNELLAFVFFENGTYAHLEVDEVAPLNPDNPEEVSGMEWGTYSVDPETGELTASITFDGNFDTGLTDSIGQVDIFVQVDGDTLTFQVDDDNNGRISEEEQTDLNRASMPQTQVYTLPTSISDGVDTFDLDCGTDFPIISMGQTVEGTFPSQDRYSCLTYVVPSSQTGETYLLTLQDEWTGLSNGSDTIIAFIEVDQLSDPVVGLVVNNNTNKQTSPISYTQDGNGNLILVMLNDNDRLGELIFQLYSDNP